MSDCAPPEPSELARSVAGRSSLHRMVGASGPEIQSAKSIIGNEVREMLRLTRQLLRPSNEVDAVAKELDAVMKPLALKIRESESPEAMRAAIDEIILEELKARYENNRTSDQS